MKNNNLDRIIKRPKTMKVVEAYTKNLSCVAGLGLVLLLSQQGHAQFVNKEEVKVNKGTLLSVYMDYDNNPSGTFTNDGEVYFFENWMNNGTVDYSASENGKTFFEGTQEQKMEGNVISNFQNLIFDNLTSLVPFQLKTTVTVGKNSDFQHGIINAGDFNGKMIFNETAVHTNAGDQSFVDGMVTKNGDAMFEFPVGNDLFFRPTFHAAGASGSNIYTTQYFHQNSGDLYSHASKEDSILEINDQEYWRVTQDQGSERIVLSLTLDHDTTPAAFFEDNDATGPAIVRWDERMGQWINDLGSLSDPITGEAYSNLLTGPVGGYGIFTMAIVKKSGERKLDVEVFNAISPNGDGINDTFHIKGLAQYPDNTVEIYNRWGVKVYDAKSYNETDNMFRGYSDGRTTIKRGDKLPTGTYFYILRYNKDGSGIEKSGYLYIVNQ